MGVGMRLLGPKSKLCLAVAGVAVLALWFRRRKATNRRIAEQRALEASKGSCPYARAVLASAASGVAMPVDVDVSRLPAGVAASPLLAFPPRHALIPFVLDAGLTDASISQVLLCCEDMTTTSTTAAALRRDDLASFFAGYVSSACPFFAPEGSEQQPVVLSVSDILSSDDQHRITTKAFSHAIVTNAYCALLGYSEEKSMVVSLVFVGPGEAHKDRVSALVASPTWSAIINSVVVTSDAQPNATPATTMSACGKGRLRAIAKPPKSSQILTACLSPCPHVTNIRVHVCAESGQVSTLSVDDSIDGQPVSVPLEGSTQVQSAAQGGPAAASSTTPSNQHINSMGASSSLDATILEAWGDATDAAKGIAPRAPLMVYANDIIGVLFACDAGSGIDEVRFASRPTVIYSPQPAKQDRGPRLSIQRARQLPDGWEQALPSFTLEEFVELLHHNIVYHLTSWQDQTQALNVVASEVGGHKAWVYHEEQDDIRCRTYVCPKLESFQPTRAAGSSQPTSWKVKELLIVRWETPSSSWDKELPQLRRVLDTMHIELQ